MSYDFQASPLYQLLMDGKRLKFPRGQVVTGFGDSEAVHLIKSGYIKRYLITKDGSTSIQIIYGPNDIFPLTPVYKSILNLDIYTGQEQYYHEAMTELEIYSVNLIDLQEALQKNPLIYKDLFYSAGLRLNSNIYRLENMSLRVSNRKVAHLLVYLAGLFSEKTEDGLLITVPLTHQNLANTLNIARETVTICLARLEEKGLIRAAGKHITILNLKGLKRVFI